MILNRLELENWLAFAGKHDVELPTGPTAIVGRYLEDPQRSNWSGKTAFLEAIEWVLFGVHRKRYDDDVIFAEADAVRVALWIEPGIYVVRSRRRGKSTKIQLEYNGHLFKQKAAQAEIETLIGFDDNDYRATQCFAQGDTEAIVERTSGERRKIVGQWLELDAWLRVAARARAAVRKLADEHRDIRAQLAVAEKALVEAPSIEELEKVIAELSGVEDRAKKDLEELDARLEKIAAMEIARLDAKKLEEVSAEGRALKSELTGAVVAGLEAARELANKLAATEATKVRELHEAVELTQGRFDGTCPVTCEECPVAEDVRANKAAALTKAERLRAEHRVARDNREDSAREVRSLEGQERAFDRKRERFKLLVAESRRLKESADRYDPDAELGDEEVQRLKFRRTQLRDEWGKARADRQGAQGGIAEIETLGADVMELGRELADLEYALRIANLAARSVGPSGVPARIAEAQLGALEERANALLATSGLRFMFAWDRVTKDLAGRCFECGYAYKGKRDKSCPACDAPREMKRADELEILVDDGSGVVEDIRAKSGGAKVLVASAIRLGAGAMLRELRGSRCAWAQVDEPFGALDAKNRRELANTFAGMIGAVGLEQAFVVSHDAALLDGLPNRIEVIRDGDRSRVEVVR